MSDALSALKAALPDVIIEEGELLAPFTALKIGGPARYFLRARSMEVLKTAVLTARELMVPFVLLGGGNSILVSDKGFAGLAIKVEDRHWQADGELVRAGSGVPLLLLARETAKLGNTGFEFLAAVPATVAGAVRTNASVEGRSVAECTVRVRVLDETGKDRWIDKEDCGFGIATSVFEAHSQWIILEAEFFLEFGSKEQAEAEALEALRQRQAKYPVNRAGSHAFKPAQRDGVLVKARELICEVGLENQTVGAAALAPEDSNLIINTGGATADQVLQLVSLLKTRVRDQLGIQLEDALELVGF